jgi:hypothetical protein
MKLLSLIAYFFSLFAPRKTAKKKPQSRPQRRRAKPAHPAKKTRRYRSLLPLNFPGAVGVLASIAGERTWDEAPVRSIEIIDEAKRIVPSDVQDYFHNLKLVGRHIKSLKKHPDPRVYERLVIEKAANDISVSIRGTESGEPTRCSVLATKSLMVDCAEKLGFDQPRAIASKVVNPSEVYAGRRMHIFDIATKCPVYLEVIGMGISAPAVRVRNTDAAIHLATIRASGWELGDGGVRRRNYVAPAQIEGAIGAHILEPAFPAAAANNHNR